MTETQNGTTRSPDQYLGLTAVGPANEMIGTVGQVYVNDRSGIPDWVTVETGLLGVTQNFVPLEGARIEGGKLVLPFGADVVHDAPRIADARHLDPDEQESLYAHYARHLGSGAGLTAAGTVGDLTTDGPADADAHFAGADTPADAGTDADVAGVEPGRARLRRYVGTGQENGTLPFSDDDLATTEPRSATTSPRSVEAHPPEPPSPPSTKGIAMTSVSGFGPTGAPGGVPDLPPPPASGQWQAPPAPPLTSSGSGGIGGTGGTGGTTTDVAKDQAASVADGAKDAARDVAGTAKEQAGQVAGEAKKQARDLVDQARSELTDQAHTQQQRVAGGLRSVSEQLRALANGDVQQGPATDLTHQAADKVSEIAAFFDNRDPGQLLDEVRRYAQRRPGMFLALALGAGVVAGRLTRGLTADSDTTTAPQRSVGTAGALGRPVGTPSLTTTPSYADPATLTPGSPYGATTGGSGFPIDPEVGR